MLRTHSTTTSLSNVQIAHLAQPAIEMASNSSLPTAASASNDTTQYASPKRKRNPPPTPPTSSPIEMRLTTNFTGVENITLDKDAQGSPRTKVAYNFQGLQLEDGGAVSKLDLQGSNAPKPKPRDDVQMEGEEALRKRVKVLNDGGEIPETPTARAFTISIGPERSVDEVVREKAKGVVLMNEVDPVIFKGTHVSRMGNKERGGLGRAYPSINRLSDSKSRGRKRMGTPPLFGSADASLSTGDDGDDGRIVDADRAALTWHDDEITGHNPDDPDDDGEGINGIGFRPTPAIAYARTEKRRQQMAEYKNREAREARAKRSERRRGSEMSKGSGQSREEKEAERRVRFMEAEKMSVISII